MTRRQNVVFLFDVDNTLLDNDKVQGDLFRHLTREFGTKARQRYVALFEELRESLGYADYLGALERYRLENLHDPKILHMSNWLIDYPFAKRLYPDALEVVKRVRRWGKAVILSDGDAVFQPRKVQRSGLGKAFAGNVLIYVHKEQNLDDVEHKYPADHYVMIDDKVRILAAIKGYWKDRVTTVFPKQGHYARDKKLVAQYPPPDIAIQRISDLLNFQRSAFLQTDRGRSL